MPDISAIAGIVSSLKAATDISKAMLDLRDGALIQSKVIELQSAILDAQQNAFDARSELYELTERMRGLEKQLASHDDWAEEKKRYELKAIGHGARVYGLKKEFASEEPAHWLCPSCFNRSKKSLLQDNGKNPTNLSEVIWRCQDCKGQIHTHYSYAPGDDK
ncbi:hypothetical protein MEX01_48400 [Methylorubrum extorquens]|uniref:hypothetical protein n=1 Tax=Methylorubrum extorquens TaxID=408 RepID=UPI0011713B67|nr:hypothetical protein [Methylorubrum extorquens]GEL44249.1 hypothetical protein MEX01_48400 [Methylorubrum extorquens]